MRWVVVIVLRHYNDRKDGIEQTQPGGNTASGSLANVKEELSPLILDLLFISYFSFILFFVLNDVTEKMASPFVTFGNEWKLFPFCE